MPNRVHTVVMNRLASPGLLEGYWVSKVGGLIYPVVKASDRRPRGASQLKRRRPELVEEAARGGTAVSLNFGCSRAGSAMPAAARPGECGCVPGVIKQRPAVGSRSSLAARQLGGLLGGWCGVVVKSECDSCCSLCSAHAMTEVASMKCGSRRAITASRLETSWTSSSRSFFFLVGLVVFCGAGGREGSQGSTINQDPLRERQRKHICSNFRPQDG